MYSGISQYGWMEASPSWFWCTVEKLDLMKQQFPKMGILSIPIGSRNTGGEGLALVKAAVEWCRRNNAKAILSKYNVANQTEADLHEFWAIFAREFKGNKTIVGFDLVNEPWYYNTGWYGRSDLVQVYERVIDAIRAIDPERTAGVQSYLKHEETMSWVRTNPVKRPNVIYVVHFYSHQWKTAEWWTWEQSHPWSNDYINKNYVVAREKLKQGMYERFGFLREELNLPVLITEVAFPDTEEGLTYGSHVLQILKEWEVNWCYHSWFSRGSEGEGRPMTLLDVDGNKRGMVQVVNNNFVDNPIFPDGKEDNRFLLLFLMLVFLLAIILIPSSPSLRRRGG